MSEDKSVKKIIFEPGCFDHMDFKDQAELDSFVKEIQTMFEGMSEEELMERSQPIDLEALMEDDPEFAQALMDQLNATEGRKLQ